MATPQPMPLSIAAKVGVRLEQRAGEVSGVNQGIVFCVCRLRVTFADEIGRTKVLVGTGFWIATDNGVDVFVTNRHNLDPTLKLGKETEFSLRKVEIQLRKQTGDEVTSETEFFEVVDWEESMLLHESADVGVLVSPKYDLLKDGFKHYNLLQQKDLADKHYITDSVALMDAGSFIGFPGSSESQWWDQEYQLGVARQLTIASYPRITFSHPDIQTSHVLLVSGLSFSGASGSVAFLHSKGINVGEMFEGGVPYVPPKIIGIMSGHWEEGDSDIPKMFRHSGLSYLTNSTAILELLEKA